MTRKVRIILYLIVIAGLLYIKYLPTDPEVVKIEVISISGELWEGSGVFVQDDIILTAGHIVQDADLIYITYLNGNVVHASSWYKEDNIDVGFIKVNTWNKEPVLRFTKPKVGQTVIAIGNPFGYYPVMTKGIVSAIRVYEPYFGMCKLLITDCPANPGNSGGPLLFGNKLVGIVIGGIFPANDFIFAVPSDICKLSLKKYLVTEELKESCR